MATAVKAIFGADSSQFNAELAKMQVAAAAAGRRIGTSMDGAHGHAGQTGIVRESTVIGREIAMGRGMGRIIASLTLLSQYINTATRNSKAAASAADVMADAYEKMAVKARLAAAEALKKAQALAAEAELEGFETEATLLAADAQTKEAKDCEAAAIAYEQKALAARNAAAADEAAAAAAVTAGGAFRALLGALGVFALLLVIIVELYVVVKSLTEILSRVSNAQKAAAEYANAHKLAIWEEIEAMEKLKEASEKTTEAIHKMNIAKDRSVELAREAMDAARMESEAREKLYDAAVKGKLLDIEIAQKKGLITSKQAIQQKAAIELQEVTDKAAAKQKALNDQARIAAAAAAKAERDKADAQAQAQAASAKINQSPEGIKRAVMLAEAEKDLQASKTAAEQARKDEVEFNKGGSNLLYSSTLKARLEGFGGNVDKAAALKETAQTLSNAAASAELRVNSLKRFMLPDERAAANAMHIAEERTGSALTLKEEARKTAIAASINAKNTPAEVAAEQADIKKKEQLDLLPKPEMRGYEINSQQKIGAYAATAPVLLQQLNVLRSIDHKVTPMHPPSNPPPGERKPQFGTKPPKGGAGWVDNGNGTQSWR